jgi:hypothetical protein
MPGLTYMPSICSHQEAFRRYWGIGVQVYTQGLPVIFPNQKYCFRFGCRNFGETSQTGPVEPRIKGSGLGLTMKTPQF